MRLLRRRPGPGAALSAQVEAVWRPGWFGLDQPLKVGEPRLFHFEDAFVPLEFVAGPLAGRYLSLEATPLRIHHESLGGLLRVHTRAGRPYLFETDGGRVLEVSAGPLPGQLLSDGPETGQPASWALAVTLAVPCGPLGRPRRTAGVL